MVRTKTNGRLAATKPQTPLLIVLLGLAVCIPDRDAIAGLSLYDQLATPSRPFFLKLRTHRGPLAMGGMRGSMWINGERIGSVLTGSDGYGYLKHEASTTGTFTLTARTSEGEARARMRIIPPSAPAIFVEGEALALQVIVRERGSAAAANVLDRIAANYELAYLCGPMGRQVLRQLISNRGLPDRVVLIGKDRNQFKQLAQRGVHIFAVVGSAPFVAAARELSHHYFSFDKTGHARHIERLEDLNKLIVPEDKTP